MVSKPNRNEELKKLINLKKRVDFLKTVLESENEELKNFKEELLKIEEEIEEIKNFKEELLKIEEEEEIKNF